MRCFVRPSLACFRTASRGFSLIELLVALSVAAVVMTASYTIFFSLQKGRISVYAKMREREKVFNLLSMARKEIESAYYAPEADHTGLKIEERDYYGRPASQLTFTGFFKDGVRVIRYAVEEDSQGRLNLVKTVTDNIMGGSPVKMTVLKDIYGFSAEALDEGYGRVFDSAILRKMPGHVRISFLMKGGAEDEAYSQICTLMPDAVR